MDAEKRLLDEIAEFHVGEFIGGGVDRKVFVWKPDPKFVIKITFGEYDFQNIAEWVLWNEAKPGLRKYLAPLHSINRSGSILIAGRCERCPAHLIPAKMPAVLADLHQDNIGLYEGRPVAMDYGRNVAVAMSANAKVMQPLKELDSTEGWRGF